MKEQQGPAPQQSRANGKRAIRVKASEVPTARPPKPERESILLPWILTTVAAVPLLLLWAWILIRPLGLIPFAWYVPIANGVGLAAILSVIVGCCVALCRRLRRPRRKEEGRASPD